MGLKRRSVGRKQVLDLTEKQDSPRRSWQTKYQQICVEHNSQNGDSPEPESGAVSSTSSKVATNNPLSGLLANYHSDSDGDDDGDNKDNAADLDSKVSDFLKEIQTIVPSGSSIVVPGQLITTPGIVDVDVSTPQQPAALSAWQECYDETTGYIYYWHTETNAVTWETPVEYLPQSVASGQAVDVAVPHEASSLFHGAMSAVHHGGLHQLPHEMHQWPHPGLPVSYPMMALNAALPPQPVQAPAMHGMRPLVEYNIKPKDRGSSDSEEERIEMITSFGESSDEESEEEIKPPSKKKKPNLEKMGPQLQELIGPMLQSSEELQVSQPESEQMDEGSNLLSYQVDDVGPPGVEIDSKPEELEMDTEEQSALILGEGGSLENSNSASELEHGKDDKEVVNSPTQLNENSSSEVDSTTDSVVEHVAVAAPTESDGGDSTETDEVGILSRLRTQARVLKELGGELPAEIQELIEPADAPVEVVIETVVPEQPTEPIEDVIIPVELPEQPPDLLPDFEKEMERMEQELKELTQLNKASSSVESSPKTTSFALIAGYGNDSDQEDESEKVPTVEPIVVQKRTFESLPTVPVKSLFPIAEHISTTEPKSPLAVKPENDSLDLELDLPSNLPLSPKVAHSILFPSVSSSTEVPLPALRLQESSEVEPEAKQTIIPPIEPIIDSTLPKKAGKRKKRLDISTSAELVAASAASKAPPVPMNTATWTYSESDLREGERKGFGFGKLETDADSFLLDCMNEFESKKVAVPKNKENIGFIKGDILNGPKPDEETKEEVAETAVIQEEKEVSNPKLTEMENKMDYTTFQEIRQLFPSSVSEADSRLEEDACKQVGDLAQTIMEKAAFLAEGKEPASPVQVLAIQIETLVSAWHVGALSRSYLSKWLGETGDELGRLETSAAPDGWACQWDRSHKRYYYCNLSSGETQWEYPEPLEEMMEAEVVPELQECPQSPQVPTVEDIAGGELAMEICNTPPHSPTPPSTPSPPARLQTPPPPPPPTISESRELSPPPPPRISPFPPTKSNEPRRQQKGKSKKRKAPPASKDKPGSNIAKQSSPTPPPPDLNPPLPPLPPPPSSPPPPPPSDMPPLPPSSPRQQLAYGEPLPPGVDPGEIPYMARPAPPPVYQNPELSPPPTADLETYQHAMQATYVLASYQSAMVQPGMVQPAMTSNAQGGPVMDYSGMPYMMHTHMAMPAVIAKPPAKKHKAALHAALDSFYSDLAIMEPTPPPEGVCEAAAVPAPILASAEDVSAAGAEPTVEPDVLLKHADPTAKKKKVKKVVGLGLKKRGVSSLVAKWQQVQQEVRRDFETLDQDTDSCQ